MKYNPSMWLPELSGAIGGTIGSHNRYGPYFKNNAVPSNPQTVRQTAMRVFFASRSQLWRGLTLAQQTAWNQISNPNYPYTDPFGNIYYLQGSDLFIALNTVLLNIGQPTISSPLLPVAVTNFSSASITMSTVAASIAFAPTPLPANHSAILYCTPGLSPGIFNFDKYLRQVTVFPTGTGSGALFLTAYTAKFGTPIAGSKVGFKFLTAINSTGQLGIAIKGSTIVT